MEFKIVAPGADEIRLLTGKMPSLGKKMLPKLTQHISAEGAFGKMAFQHYAGEGFEIWFSNYHFDNKLSFIGRSDEFVLELHIQFMNQFDTAFDGTAKQTLLPYQFNLSFTPFMNSTSSFLAGAECHTFDIHFSKQYLQRLAHAFPLLDKFLLNVEKGIACDITKVNYLLDQEMIRLINEVLRKTFRHDVADFYLDSKVRELIILALERVSGIDHNKPIIITPATPERMYEAREFLLSDFEKRPTILQLARHVGTNDYKLKKEFKQFFGASIFEYFQNERLEKAKELLMQQKLSVTDIAHMTGYDHVRNFSNAFKKKFGYPPSFLRKEK